MGITHVDVGTFKVLHESQFSYFFKGWYIASGPYAWNVKLDFTWDLFLCL